MASKKSKTANSKVLEKTREGGEIVAFDYGEEAGAGFEGQTQADIQVPILGIIQDLSPQTKESKPEFIPGAAVGMLFNPVTEELVPGDEGIVFVPAATDHCFVEWVPRKKGGGFVARHELDSPVVAAARASGAKINDWKTDEGNELLETFYVYGVRVDSPVPQPMILAMSKSKIKVYRKWNTKVRQHMIEVGDGRKQNPPLYANLVRITTFQDVNANGDEFFNFAMGPAVGDTLAESLLAPNDPRFQAAKQIGELFKKGHAQADYSTQGASTGGESDDVPF